MLTTLNTFNNAEECRSPSSDVGLSWTTIYALEIRFWKYFAQALIVPSSQLTCSVIIPHSTPSCLPTQFQEVFFLFFLYGLLTSWEFFQSLGLSFHFQMSAMLTRAIRAPAVCRHGRATSMMRKGHQLMSAGMRYLIGYCVLIREPLSAWEVFIHCWYNLQYVVMWSKSCKRHNIN